MCRCWMFSCNASEGCSTHAWCALPQRCLNLSTFDHVIVHICFLLLMLELDDQSGGAVNARARARASPPKPKHAARMYAPPNNNEEPDKSVRCETMLNARLIQSALRESTPKMKPAASAHGSHLLYIYIWCALKLAQHWLSLQHWRKEQRGAHQKHKSVETRKRGVEVLAKLCRSQ